MHDSDSVLRVLSLVSLWTQALQHILHKSGYNYYKRLDVNHMVLLTMGPGIIWAEGQFFVAYESSTAPYNHRS